MADSTLSREQVLELYARLSKDDQYRALFERSPVDALMALGVSKESIAGINAACLAPTTLADKRLFVTAHAKLNDQNWTECLQMIVPNFRLGAQDSNQ